MVRSANDHGHIPFEGIHNFRDIGGYKTANGRSVKHGMIYRSGHLAAYTDADLEKLKDLGLRTIMDFRSLDEVAQNPDPSIVDVCYIHYPAVEEGQINADLQSIAKLNKDRMIQFYRDIPIGNETYRQLFRMLVEGDHTPLLMHCTGGKDRTGGAAALILLALGVPRETVMEDYLLTNVYLEDFTNQVIGMYRMMLGDEEIETMRLMLSAKAEFLDVTLNRIEEMYGNFETYLREDLRVNMEDQERLKALYLE